jgi:transcriptional regulator with XRE-family HTH domain
MKFAKMLKDRRAAKKYTQATLADLVGCTPSYISELENGQKLPPPQHTTIRIAYCLRFDDETDRDFQKFEEEFWNAAKEARDAHDQQKSERILTSYQRVRSAPQQTGVPFPSNTVATPTLKDKWLGLIRETYPGCSDEVYRAAYDFCQNTLSSFIKSVATMRV